SCAKCVEACPVSVPDLFEAGLSARRAIYRATDGKFVVDDRACSFVQDHVCVAGDVGAAGSVEPACVAACAERAIDVTQTETSTELEVGAIVVATGAATFEASKKPELGFGRYSNVITSLQFERLASRADGFPDAFKSARRVVFVQCVGSRDETSGNSYCSRVCCMVNAKQAHTVKERLPDASVTVLYADVRAFGKGHEEFYDAVRKEGVRYRRGYVSEIFKRGDELVVRAEDTLLQTPVEIPADLVVLGIGLTPRAETDEIANLLGLPRSGDGFLLEIHPKLRPVETAVDGVFLAGTCQGPKDIVDTLAQARAAASSALAPLCRGQVKVESATSRVNEDVCAGCGLCVAACPYGAPAINPRTGKARVNAVLCKGCGACQAACPSKAIQVMQSTSAQILSQVAVLA
ncbi:MAG: FAD-dependent oxidoreductase, partial [Chloroflexi bacterium]|nr:FAD-dependent oxidoreductase [Chloroflexota bacterium]